MAKLILLVGAGGGIGTILRYLVFRWLGFSLNGFPLSTFFVNLLGCFFDWSLLGCDGRRKTVHAKIIFYHRNARWFYNIFKLRAGNFPAFTKWKMEISVGVCIIL